MSARRQHPKSRHTGPWRQIGIAAALLLTACLGACAAAQPPSAAPTTAALYLPYDGELDAGTYIGSGYAVPYEITVPDGWTMNDGWLLLKDRDGLAVFLNFLAPSAVPTEACKWGGTIREVDPSVEGFTDALAAQTATTTTDPVDVSVGGYGGVEFDISVDKDVDVSTCSATNICIHSESRGHCTRYYQDVNRSETYRVLDLDGERAVMSVGKDAGVAADLEEEARAIFDSIVFRSSE